MPFNSRPTRGLTSTSLRDVSTHAHARRWAMPRQLINWRPLLQWPLEQSLQHKDTVQLGSQLPTHRSLLALGPWVVFIMTFAETAFILGLVLPAEPTIMAACLLSLEGHFGLGGVVAATLAGGALGDT